MQMYCGFNAKKGVFGGEATQVSPKLGNLLSRLFPDTSTPFILEDQFLHSRKNLIKITEGITNLFAKTN
jgi:hypothetical protein